MSKAFYSLIQFVPDLGRQEAFNVGVAVACLETGFAEVALTKGFGTCAPGGVGLGSALFEATKVAFAGRFKDEARRFRAAEDMAAFKASGTNPLRLTPPRQVVLQDAAADVRTLFERLVEVPAPIEASRAIGKGSAPIETSRAVGRGPRVQTRLRAAFAARNVAELVERDVKTFVPAFGTSLKVPYAYQNGRYNLIEPVDFTMRDEGDRERRLAWFAVAGKSIYETPDKDRGERKLIVVARLPDLQAEARKVSDMLEEFHVDCVPLSETGLNQLASEIIEHRGGEHRPGKPWLAA